MSPDIFIQLLGRNHELARSTALSALKCAIAKGAKLDDIPRIAVDTIHSVQACVDETDSESLRSAVAALETDGFFFRNIEDGGTPCLRGSLGINDWIRIYHGEHGVHFNVESAAQLELRRSN
ncbi:hypothetical protein [Bradyrhizobium sp. 45]|uniref:hypothetical protein n=1 Tax=Bradyrhizobium sp. 45 TaxID=1043587 RepID=UPI001FFAB5AC|nr:hypothetical protein [Bradyrhizobium sp. 45]MCK1307692.1 hypothetical protein [Bradyrhizobium sp. 45]